VSNIEYYSETLKRDRFFRRDLSELKFQAKGHEYVQHFISQEPSERISCSRGKFFFVGAFAVVWEKSFNVIDRSSSLAITSRDYHLLGKQKLKDDESFRLFMSLSLETSS
jgi:hypothetical protein